jgi:hypothetical protein
VDNPEAALHAARADVLHDLEVMRVAQAAVIDLLEDALATRRWWLEQWPEGATYIAGLIAQDVQDGLLESVGRWPLCPACEDGSPHGVYIHPELGGPDPVWVCEESGATVAALGGLSSGR